MVLAGQQVLLNQRTGVYYGLNETGSFLWQKICEGCTEHEMVQSLLEEYETTEVEARKDVRQLLKGLQNEGLIREEASGENPG